MSLQYALIGRVAFPVDPVDLIGKSTGSRPDMSQLLCLTIWQDGLRENLVLPEQLNPGVHTANNLTTAIWITHIILKWCFNQNQYDDLQIKTNM